MPYPEQMVAPMRAELTNAGVQELRTPAEVDNWFAQTQGSALLLVNSVCGCAAGSARPASSIALAICRFLPLLRSVEPRPTFAGFCRVLPRQPPSPGR